MSENLQVRALYDFEAQPTSGELTIWKDEILTVTRKDVGEGWWEGVNTRGESGLFPAGYVEIISSSAPPPTIPPPPLPELEDDDWDDDWDDNESSTGKLDPAHATMMPTGGTDSARVTDNHKTVVKKSFNRFSSFVKTGAESFILGQNKIYVAPESKVIILDDGDTVMWQPNPRPYTCTIASPKKASKMKGLKSFIAYQLTSNLSPNPVHRRYKHFDWLHERLQEKFTLIPMAPLPDKQISGRYQDDFIEHRRMQLQMWINRVCKHPVLSQAEVWIHFLTCLDEKNWKTGKRKAEKDPLVGASFCNAIQSPSTPLEAARVEKELDNFSKSTSKMDETVKNLFYHVQDSAKKTALASKKEFQRFGQLFTDLSSCFELSTEYNASSFSQALKHTGDTFDTLGKLYEDQPKYDLEPMADVLREYKGMLASWPDILQIQKTSMGKKKEYQKLAEESKMDQDEMAALCQRIDIISYAVLAEKNHFLTESVKEHHAMIVNFLRAQRDFYQDITQRLDTALNQYENIPY